MPDAEDVFPFDLTESVDSDLDGTGNNADTDDDNDTVPDAADAFPLDPTESIDTDGDGIENSVDARLVDLGGGSFAFTDESGVFSNNFARPGQGGTVDPVGSTFGIYRAQGSAIVPSNVTAGVQATVGGAGSVAQIRPCGKLLQVLLDTAGQIVDISCNVCDPVLFGPFFPCRCRLPPQRCSRS